AGAAGRAAAPAPATRPAAQAALPAPTVEPVTSPPGPGWVPASLAEARDASGFEPLLPAVLGEPDGVYVRSEGGAAIQLVYVEGAGLRGVGAGPMVRLTESDTPLDALDEASPSSGPVTRASGSLRLVAAANCDGCRAASSSCWTRACRRSRRWQLPRRWPPASNSPYRKLVQLPLAPYAVQTAPPALVAPLDVPSDDVPSDDVPSADAEMPALCGDAPSCDN